jgi:hypothetical protein
MDPVQIFDVANNIAGRNTNTAPLSDKQQLIQIMMGLAKDLQIASRQLNASGVVLSPRVFSMSDPNENSILVVCVSVVK